MLFSSLEYIFLFLPLTLLIYYFFLQNRLILGSKIFLIIASLFFYSYWNIKYLPLLLFSIIANYVCGSFLVKRKNKVVAILAIFFNLSLLGYFKYANFFIENINILISSADLVNPKIILPLAISFFTFQQIAYISDCYQKKLQDRDFLNYAIFVSFFPQLIAGPIVHHKTMMPQFKGLKNKFINYDNIALGIFIFAVGLFKKIVIADYFSSIVNSGFDSYQNLTLIDSWKTSLSYTAQLYFDFSGYSDMAIGSALMFNIKIPFNFNQPYKSCNIREFWQRWHITLSNFLKSYVYIPLGGNRVGKFRIYANLMMVFLISGLWHGAGWTFIFWGLLHGSAICIHHFYDRLKLRMNRIVAWFITFNFINISWVFFRSENFIQATTIVKKMVGININNTGFIENWYDFLQFIRFNKVEYLVLATSLFLAYKLLPIIAKDSEQLIKKFRINNNFKFITICLLAVSILSYHKTSEFLYFNF